MKKTTLDLSLRETILIAHIAIFYLAFFQSYGNASYLISDNYTDIRFAIENDSVANHRVEKPQLREISMGNEQYKDVYVSAFLSADRYDNAPVLSNLEERTKMLQVTIVKIQDATTTGSCCNGIAKVIATGGTPGYTYRWHDSARNQTTAKAIGLTSRYHCVTVTDGSGAEITKAVKINCIDDCKISLTHAISDVSCVGEATGKIDLCVRNGTPPYTFTWDTGATTEDLIDVVAGEYTVTVEDANNCSFTETYTVTEPLQPLTLAITSNPKNPCNEPGRLIVCGRGGTAPYSYSIDDRNTFQTSGSFKDLDPGRYHIIVRDANECETLRCIDVTTNCTEAITDINNTFMNTPVSGSVLTNDKDLEGDTQKVITTTVTTATGIVVTIDPDTGTYTYAPPSNFIGEDTFEYTIVDNGNPMAKDTAMVYIEVLPKQNITNRPPIANVDAVSTNIDTEVTGNVLINDFDPDRDELTITTSAVTTTEGIPITIDTNTGIFTYTPPLGFIGEDTFEYTICDNGDSTICDTALVTITVFNTSNNSTYANDDAYFVTECETLSGNVLDNDFDPEGDTQIVAIRPLHSVNNGVLTINETGAFTYVPNSQFVGTDSFVYTVCDTGNPEACDQATVYFTISDNVPPDIVSCTTTNTTIECSGMDNEAIADNWNLDNIEQLSSCISNACGTDFNGTISSNYDFNSLIPSCGLGGTLEVTYTISDENDNSTTYAATLTLIDTTPPALESCVLEDINLECSALNAQELADQWDVDNILLLESCVTDGCSENSFTVTSNYDFTRIEDGTLTVDYIVTDECNNSNTITSQLRLDNNDTIAASDISLCAASDIESQIVDLFDLIEGEINFDGTWEVISGNATIIDNQFFDPLTVALSGQNDSETITLGYTEDSSGCPIYVETEIEVHNRCAVFACGDEDIKISKVLTPNGDSFNEFFIVDGVEECNYVIDLKILNRWGALVYQSQNYKNDWNGTSSQASIGTADQVPTGTYYYIVTLNNSGLQPFSEPFYIGTK
ncbi:tandem-95 repeat protein [Aquimarina sp. U1-2]|uniref:Ig-like domain-containing protein n=1 Tax=Aquimarina sp. U1-2 TaxID=2823141 RepID=UPI001AECB66B|nr:Ig-like domain-containing protein [Aquimarina sp. U1-2]MBP2833903.1 tandem-95 repeat protein [Aquimarina sp. U1-2]